jgi:hypothetical protein
MLLQQFLPMLLVTDNGQVSPIPKWDLAPIHLVSNVSLTISPVLLLADHLRAQGQRDLKEVSAVH